MEFELKSSGIDNSIYLHDEAHSDKNEEEIEVTHDNNSDHSEQENTSEQPTTSSHNNRSNTMPGSYRHASDTNMSDEKDDNNDKKKLRQSNSTMSKSGSYRYTSEKVNIIMSDKKDDDNDKAKQSKRSDSTMSKSGSYRYTSDKSNDNGDEKDTEKQLKKSEDKAPPSRSYHFTNTDDDDMKKSKHGSDNNMLSPHSYGYDNHTLDNDESRIRRKDSSVEHRICSNKDDGDFIVKRKRSGNMSYETIVWVVFFVCNVVILVDRFTGNGDFVFGRKSRFL